MNAHLLAFLAVVAICVVARLVGMVLGDRAAAEPVRGALPDADEEWLGELRGEGS